MNTVSLADHIKCYNFEDPGELIGNFLLNVKSKFVPSTEVFIRCAFLLKNIQPEPVETVILIRYWLTDVYTTKYFNNYLFFSLKRDIKKRILANSQSGSSWRFRRFIYLNLKIHPDNSKLI